MRALIVYTELTDEDSVISHAVARLASELNDEHVETVIIRDFEDGLAYIRSNTSIDCLLYGRDMSDKEEQAQAHRLITQLHRRQEDVPVFLLSDREEALVAFDRKMMEQVDEFAWILEDSADFIAGRVLAAIIRYRAQLLPPLMKSLIKYSDVHEHSWAAPGHQGGVGFTKTPAGRIYHDFFGENLFRTDIGIERVAVGSLLDHTGAFGECEKNAARIFGADQSYSVVVGTSGSNRTIMQACMTDDDVVVIDRNCHKSLAHLLMMNDVVPLWLKPTRNALGILGGIPKREFTRDSLQQKVNATENAQWPVHAVITNSTYDGLLYNTNWIKQTLDVPSIHFDSAWVPYTHFHPIYQGKSGMSGERVPGKVFFETQSTHKMLAALSQASLIHIKGDYDEDTFNEAFMMHTSTSPSYPIVASIETAAAMLRGNSGKRLIQRSIERALHFRKEVQRLREEADGWFFDIWQPEEVDEAQCWPVSPGEAWHGFQDADDDHMFLDPVKVTILTPGMDEQGNMAEEGIPAALVAKFLDERGVVVEKTGPYNLLFLFSIGIDKTRAMGLLRGLTEFKRAYDLNLRVKNMLPDLYAEDPDFYRNMRIQDLAQGIHRLIRQHQLSQLMLRAFDVLPEMKMTPHQAWQRQIKGEVETIELENLVGRISANMILPYPPGVPLLMPGEMITEESRAVLDFLLMLCSIGRHYPGFETDIHGAKRDEDGVYRVRVLKNN